MLCLDFPRVIAPIMPSAGGLRHFGLDSLTRFFSNGFFFTMIII